MKFSLEIPALLCLFIVPQLKAVDIQDEQIHGRDAVVVSNEKIRVSFFPGGGYIGEVRFKSDDAKLNVNPMRVPHYETIEPQDYVDEVHNVLYGSSGDRKVMAGYMGHFLCFPYTGGLSKAEKDQGLFTHGEAAVTEWELKDKQADENAATLTLGVYLPLTQYRIGRLLTVVEGESVVYVDERVENLVSFDRPFQWVQHTTFGEPFVEAGKNFVDAPVVAPVWNQNPNLYRSFPVKTWPEATDLHGENHNLRVMETTEGEGSYWAWLLDDSETYTWFTMYHSEYQVLIGYLMPAEWNPWIGDWQENKFKTHVPWNGEVVARGLLIGTSPFTGGIRSSMEIGPLYGKHTVRWINANESITQNYLIFLAKIPIGYQGTESLSVVNGFIHLKERNTRRLISVKASRSGF
jgi:hypothetical protein